MNKIFMRLVYALIFNINPTWSSEPPIGNVDYLTKSQELSTQDPVPVTNESDTNHTIIPTEGTTTENSDSTNVQPPADDTTHPTISTQNPDSVPIETTSDGSNAATSGDHVGIPVSDPRVQPEQGSDSSQKADSGDSGILAPVHSHELEHNKEKALIPEVSDDKSTEEQKTTEDEDDSYDSIAASKGAAEQLLGHLFGDAIDSFAGDANHRVQKTMTIDCNSRDEDTDYSVNIITTLCPLLRPDGPCGQLRHPTYEVESKDMFCSDQCRPQVDVIMKAFRNRANLSHKHEVIIY
jgi:hypothetical protein